MNVVKRLSDWVAVHSPALVIYAAVIMVVLALRPWRLAMPSEEDAAITVAALGLLVVGLTERRKEREGQESVALAHWEARRERHERTRASIGVWVGVADAYDVPDRHVDGMLVIALRHEDGERAERIDCVGYPDGSVSPARFEGQQDVLLPSGAHETGPPLGWSFTLYDPRIVLGGRWRIVLTYDDRLGGRWETDGALEITPQRLTSPRYEVRPGLRVPMSVPHLILVPEDIGHSSSRASETSRPDAGDVGGRRHGD